MTGEPRPAVLLEDVTLRLPALRRRRFFGRRPRAVPGTGSVGGSLAAGEGAALSVSALNGVNLAIGAGRRVGLIGENGAGKSVLLKTIAGIYLPTTGRCEAPGRVHTLFRGMPGAIGDATGLENVMIAALTLGLDRDRIEELLPEIIAFSELGDYVHVPLRTYSAGMHTRLAFAVITAFESELLLIDEIIGTGDRRFLARAQERLRERNPARTTIVASHSPGVLQGFCDEAVWIDNGQVRMTGPVEEVLERFGKA